MSAVAELMPETIARLSPADVGRNYAAVAGLLREPVARMGRLGLDAVVSCLHAGTMHAFAAWDRGDIEAVCVGQFMNYPRRRVLALPYVSDPTPERFDAEVSAWARANGAAEVEAYIAADAEIPDGWQLAWRTIRRPVAYPPPDAPLSDVSVVSVPTAWAMRLADEITVMLGACAAETRGRYKPGDIVAEILSGRMHLWVAGRDGFPFAMAAGLAVRFDGHGIYAMPFLGGTGLKSWLAMQPVIMQAAAEAGCDALEGYDARGGAWARVLRDWTVKHLTIVRPL
jgi:hypothetical protein